MAESTTLHKLIQLLADGQFHSGQDLGQQLNMTRSAIWKTIRNIQKFGIQVESITGKGYRLPQPIELLEQQRIRDYLSSDATQCLDHVIVLNQVDSTNDYLRASINNKQTIAVFAEQQTAGKGRRGKHWVSPFATNIYHSLAWHFDCDPSKIVGLSLAVAVAVVDALNAYGVQQSIQVKWPNDIYFQHKKLAGVLLEMIAEPHGHCSVIIGIGINTQMNHSQSDTIDQAWTSLYEITQSAIQRNKLAGLLINHVTQTLMTFSEHGLEPFLQKWRELDCFIGKPVVIHTPSKQIHGIMRDVDQQGALMLQTENSIEHFLSGDVSLRQDT